MYRDLTKGSITKGLLLFALPMIAGNLLQQFYNIADTLIVGQALGKNALAAVGSAYALMTFLTSIFLGLSMGAGALFSIALGQGDEGRLRRAAQADRHGAVSAPAELCPCAGRVHEAARQQEPHSQGLARDAVAS